MLKKIFNWIGIFILGFILLFIVIGVFSGYKAATYKETAVPYIKDVIPQISEWDAEKSKQFFVPSTLNDISDEDFQKLFQWFSKLGELKSLDEPTFSQVHSGATVNEGASTIVTYSIAAQYENGDAQITIKLLDLGDSFEIYSFNLNTIALFE